MPDTKIENCPFCESEMMSDSYSLFDAGGSRLIWFRWRCSKGACDYRSPRCDDEKQATKVHNRHVRIVRAAEAYVRTVSTAGMSNAEWARLAEAVEEGEGDE